MPRIEVITEIDAPMERVFDLARSIDVHCQSQTRHDERAIAGRTTGLIEPDEVVTWEATHLGIRQRLTSRISRFERPHLFRDTMVSGAFSRFDHDHLFERCGDRTLMRDVFDYTSPMGWLGRIFDILWLKGYMTRFLKGKGTYLKEIAESERWREFLSSGQE